MKLFDKLKTYATSHIGLVHPHVTFNVMVAGIVAIAQSEHDYVVLAGASIGPKLYIVVKWFGAACTAIAGAGRSVLSSVDKPADNSEPAKEPEGP